MADKIILLVEDEPADAMLTERAFKERKLANELRLARDGAEALDYLLGPGAGTREKPFPCLVLLDLKLPKVDGLDVLRTIREDPRTRRLPVVILTSSREERDLVDCYDLGANSYICKPVDFLQFAEAMKQLGLCWLLLNEPPPAGG
jgi:two-component system, response regulator